MLFAGREDIVYQRISLPNTHFIDESNRVTALQATKLVESNTPIQTGEFKDSEVDIIRDWGCITTKPQIYVVNLSQKNFIRKGNKWLQKIVDWVKEHGGGQILPVSCEFEQTLYDLKDDPENLKGKFVT